MDTTTMKTKAGQLAREALEIYRKADAEGRRELTPQELVVAQRKAQEAQKLKSDADVLDSVDGLMAGVGGPIDHADAQGGSAHAGGGAPGGLGGKRWAQTAAKAMTNTAAAHGVKAMVVGDVSVPSPIEAGIVELPQDPRRLLDLITTRRTISGTNTFSYLQQVARTNNAAPVADGALKPTSLFTIEEVEDRLRVIAHLSEPIPERLLSDVADLERWLTSEMQEGLLQSLEAQVTSGDGVGENMTGLLNTSGTVAVAFGTDMLTTARKAVTAMEKLGERPTAWLLSPDDGEAFDLIREEGATGAFMLTQGSDLWRLPRVHSLGVPAGTAVLGDFAQLRLVQSGQVSLAANRSGENFRRNLVEMRVEGRYGFEVLRPQAFAVVELAAA